MEESKRTTIDDALAIVSKIDSSKYLLATVGRNNWVFLSKSRCISIPKYPEKTNYKIRVAAMKYLKENNIPTTELIDYGTKDGVEYILTKKIRAKNVDLSLLDLEKQMKIHEQCALMARKLHKFQFSGYGRLNEKLEGNHSSWRSFVEDFFESAMRRMYKIDFVRDKFSKQLMNKFSTFEKILDDSQKAFLHGDYHIGNLLFDNEKIAAVIDLDIVMSGDLYWDLGHYVRTFKGDRVLGKKVFSSVYGEWNEDKANFYALIIWTRKLASQGETRPEALIESAKEMERILTWSI